MRPSIFKICDKVNEKDGNSKNLPQNPYKLGKLKTASAAICYRGRLFIYEKENIRERF